MASLRDIITALAAKLAYTPSCREADRSVPFLLYAKVKSFDKNLAPMISRAYTRHKLWSKLIPKNA